MNAAEKLRRIAGDEDLMRPTTSLWAFDGRIGSSPYRTLRDLLVEEPQRTAMQAQEERLLLELLGQRFRHKSVAAPVSPEAPPSGLPAPTVRSAGPAYAELERWYVEVHIPDVVGHSNREQDLKAARERFGCWTKDHVHLRDVRARCAPAGWKKPGPRQ